MSLELEVLRKQVEAAKNATQELLRENTQLKIQLKFLKGETTVSVMRTA